MRREEQEHPRVEANLESVIQNTASFFRQLQGQRKHIVAEFGDPTAGSFDYSEVLARLDDPQSASRLRNISGLVDMLFESGVSPGVLSNMSSRLLKGKFVLRMTDIKRRFFGEDLASKENLKCKHGGEEWLKRFIRHRVPYLVSDLEAYRAQELAHGVSSKYGHKAAIITRLMFMCSSDESNTGTPQDQKVSPMPRFRAMIRARQQEATTRAESITEGLFFDQMRDFISVFADITEKAINNSANLENKAKIEMRSRKALARFLQSAEFQKANLGEEEAPPNPFQVFRSILLGDKDMNPWVTEGCEDTPFDVSKFGLLMSEDVPRGLVADAVLFLNNYKGVLLAQKINKLIQSINTSRAVAEKARERGKESPESNTPPPLPPSLEERVDGAILQIQEFNAPNAQIPDDIGSKIGMLADFVSRNIVFSPERDTEEIHPFAVLLRIVDSEKVVTNQTLRHEFTTLLSNIPVLKLVEEVEEEVHEDKTIAGAEEQKDALERIRRNILTAASSVQEFLSMPEDGGLDQRLDVPLLEVAGNPSIRDLVTDMARRCFDNEVWTMGPRAHSPGRTGKFVEGPLVMPRDVLETTSEQIKALKKNFNTAAGTTLKRTWITNACAKWAELFPNSFQNFQAMHRFVLGQAEKYWRTGSETIKYQLALYPSATVAMNDVVNRLMPNVSGGDYIITSRQEYPGITAAFTGRGATVEAIDCNDREHNRAKGADEIFASIIANIENRRKSPTAFIFSSKTRFGDSVGVMEAKRVERKDGTFEIIKTLNTPNSHGLRKLVGLLKKEYPTIPAIVDGCQSIGRNDEDETDLVELGADVYLASGGKALGIDGNVGFVALRSEVEPRKEKTKTPARKSDKPEESTMSDRLLRDITFRYKNPLDELEAKNWLAHQELAVQRNPLSKLNPTIGTVDIQRFAAFGIAIQRLMSTNATWAAIAVDDKRTQTERVAEHARRLTQYAIEKAEQYADSLVTNGGFPFNVTGAQLSDPRVQHQFGCKVVIPVHRHRIDYSGMLAVTFPNLWLSLGQERKKAKTRGDTEDPLSSGGHLKSVLQRRGFLVERCLSGDHAIRISFHELHDESDIDALFKAIETEHIKSIEGQLKPKDIKNFEDLMEKTPNESDEWMDQ